MILLASFIAFKSITTKHAHTLRVITSGIACTNLRFLESIKPRKSSVAINLYHFELEYYGYRVLQDPSGRGCFKALTLFYLPRLRSFQGSTLAMTSNSPQNSR